ncbi:MAG TPA: GGDEF domain-containing protein [Alphaproteobacteria bacterium]|nr:GGDEF domain-containing protein [Alphaproteobacteria bacterium]
MASIGLVGDNGPAGRLLRLILIVSVLTAGIFGAAIYAAYRLDYIGVAGGVALFGVIAALLFVAAALRGAWMLNAEHLALNRLRTEVQSHALQDPQTGLANRSHFMDQLARRAALADRRTSAPFAVCSLELDGIGEAARQLGEGNGNRILAKAGDVIRDCVRASDLVARLEGDRFAILLEEIADARDIDILAERIMSSVPTALEELVRDAPAITVSIGVVMKNSGQDRPGEMLREADAALQVAKRRGPGRFELTAFAD